MRTWVFLLGAMVAALGAQTCTTNDSANASGVGTSAGGTSTTSTTGVSTPQSAAGTGGTGGGATQATSTSSTSVSSSSSSTSNSSSSSGGGGAGQSSGTIVPLYTDPSDSSWTAIVSAKANHPTVTVQAIINPNNGPGDQLDSAYVTGTAALKTAGIVVLGYVATGYGKDAVAGIHTYIQDYKTWYPAVTGIFFDEMSAKASDAGFYSALTQYAKGLGFVVTVGNAGADVDEGLVGTVDTILIYESNGLPTIASLGGWHANYPKSNFGVIPYAVPSLDANFVMQARESVGFVYLTNDDLPNPWDSLSSYFDGLLGALE